VEKIKVFIIDDSAIIRDVLTRRLGSHPEIEVVGSALDPYIARDKIDKLAEIDVITLDIEMPRMDGLTFLKYLMKSRPIPVIIVSSVSEKGNKATLEALELGAIDIVAKPGGPLSIDEVVDTLIQKILLVRRIDKDKFKTISDQIQNRDFSQNSKILTQINATNKLIAVGASTGGTQALETLFKSFTKDFPPTLAVIHMPERFTMSFANRLNDLCEVTVKEATNGEKATNGSVYVAPGNYHMIVKSVGTERIIKVVDGPKIFNQRPAVDALFDSVAKEIGKNSIGILLTGMGKDGAKGLLNIKNCGGFTIAQDEESSIVWGMPKEAIDLGAANKVLGLNSIANFVKNYLK